MTIHVQGEMAALKYMLHPIRLAGASLALAAMTLGAGCEHQVTFAKDVQPVLQEKCLQCHQPGGQGYERSGLDMRTYESLMQGTRFGKVIIPGDSMDSVLMQLAEHRADPSINMPYQHPKLTDDSLKVLKTWIDQGAKP